MDGRRPGGPVDEAKRVCIDHYRPPITPPYTSNTEAHMRCAAIL